MANAIPYIPEYITVHLGTPQSYAQNVTVSFPDYIKNVASSEIYPTWNESAVIANIHAQVSFALNRVYLEFYLSQGYNFQITNSTAFDQSYQQGRNIFDNIDRIVDELFNDYIRRIGFIEPLAAKYCNGTTTTCKGLSQWGSEALAQQGYNSIDILQYYYGENIEIVQNATVMGIRASYPGYAIRPGSTSAYVKVIQTSLNRISQNYPSIPKIYPVDGIFDEATENAVKTFQGIFNLTQDGIVGKATWYKIVFLYVGIQSFGELESEGQKLFGLSLEYPDAISEGNVGEKVSILQYFLSVLAEFYMTQPFVEITGVFGEETKKAVIAFQKSNDLPQTGVVNDVTWNEMYRVYIGIIDIVFRLNAASIIPASPFSGTVLTLGAEGEEVKSLQQYLNEISLTYVSVSPVEVTGIFGNQTRTSVMEYQRRFELPVTGEVDRTTWNSIINTYKDVVSASTTAPTQFPGYPLKLGSQDKM